MSSNNGAGPKAVAKPGMTSSARFAAAEERYADQIGSMSGKQKSLLGLPYLATDDGLIDERIKARLLCREFNMSPCGPLNSDETGANDVMNENRRQLIGDLFQISPEATKRVFIDPPFHCDYGTNIKFDGDFYCNFGTTILDCAEVRFGHGVLIGPGCHIYAATHSISVTEREKGFERALPVSIGTNTWVGGNVTIMAGVDIGEGCTIGAGSVVTRSIPSWSVAVGNPARIVKVLEESEKGRRDGKSNMVPFPTE